VIGENAYKFRAQRKLILKCRKLGREESRGAARSPAVASTGGMKALKGEREVKTLLRVAGALAKSFGEGSRLVNPASCSPGKEEQAAGGESAKHTNIGPMHRQLGPDRRGQMWPGGGRGTGCAGGAEGDNAAVLTYGAAESSRFKIEFQNSPGAVYQAWIAITIRKHTSFIGPTQLRTRR